MRPGQRAEQRGVGDEAADLPLDLGALEAGRALVDGAQPTCGVAGLDTGADDGAVGVVAGGVHPERAEGEVVVLADQGPGEGQRRDRKGHRDPGPPSGAAQHRLSLTAQAGHFR